jgi:hypothetical protein
MIISVTQKHIDEGLRGSCTSDPVALAMKDAGLFHPWVSPSGLSWEDERKTAFHTSVPDEVLDFMRNFDNIRFVDPFEFEVEES